MDRHERSGRFDAAGWAIFFTWVGVAWLADVGIGIVFAGFWQWFDIQKPLALFILIAAGVGLLAWKTWPRSRHRDT